jgi:hypothetical protein
VAYVTGLVSFSLLVELLLLPVAIFFGAVGAFAARQSNGKAAVVLSSVVLASMGFSAVTWSFVQLFRGLNSDAVCLVSTFALTVWLPSATLPFIYVTAFMAEYGRVLALVRASSGTRPTWLVRLACLSAFEAAWRLSSPSSPTRMAFVGTVTFGKFWPPSADDPRSDVLKQGPFA